MVKKTKNEKCWKSWSGSGKPGGNGDCCCNCISLVRYYSHPWVDGMPFDHQIGWICVNECTGAHVSKRHGLCEIHQRGKSPFDEKNISAKNRREFKQLEKKRANGDIQVFSKN